jgi:hypothetical protein
MRRDRGDLELVRAPDFPASRELDIAAGAFPARTFAAATACWLATDLRSAAGDTAQRDSFAGSARSLEACRAAAPVGAAFGVALGGGVAPGVLRRGRLWLLRARAFFSNGLASAELGAARQFPLTADFLHAAPFPFVELLGRRRDVRCLRCPAAHARPSKETRRALLRFSALLRSDSRTFASQSHVRLPAGRRAILAHALPLGLVETPSVI